jgi:hypothetical protein
MIVREWVKTPGAAYIAVGTLLAMLSKGGRRAAERIVVDLPSIVRQQATHVVSGRC